MDRASEDSSREDGAALCEDCNFADLIIEAPYRSVTRYEFYKFQKAFDAINWEFDLNCTGLLDLMDELDRDRRDPEWPKEFYSGGKVSFGDSVGRPVRHRRPLAQKERW